MKFIPLITFFLATTLLHADDNKRADYSTFTPKQLAEHLGLSGGNWTISFDEKLYCGFIITEISKDGATQKKYYWSSGASKNHYFYFMHHVKKKLQRADQHQVSFSSSQEGEWKSEGDRSRWKISRSSGFAYDTQLPSNGGSKTQFRNSSVKIPSELPELLYSWSSTETKQAFKLEVIFSKSKTKEEQVEKP